MKWVIAVLLTVEVLLFCVQNVKNEKTSLCQLSNEDFKCSSFGRFSDLSDPTCKSYILCSKLRNGTFIKTFYSCPGKSCFNPDISKCSEKYYCPCATTSSSTTELTTTTAIITTASGCDAPPLKEFQCRTEGRFADLRDMTCTKYFLCSHLRNGTFIQTSYQCKRSSFNPLLGKCGLRYYCPCSSDQTTSKTTLSVATTTEGFALVTTRNPYDCDGSWPNPLEFQCENIGRYPDHTDNTCRKYFLCSLLRNGTYVKTRYRCPTSTCINASMQKCSAECVCPCTVNKI